MHNVSLTPLIDASTRYLSFERKKLMARKTRREYQKRHSLQYKPMMSGIITGLKNRPCADCGVAYHPKVMDFDHKPGYVKIVGVSRMVLKKYSLETVLEEISKCDIVCSNCHRMRTCKLTLRTNSNTPTQEELSAILQKHKKIHGYQKTCPEEGCSNPIKARNLCEFHYNKVRRVVGFSGQMSCSCGNPAVVNTYGGKCDTCYSKIRYSEGRKRNKKGIAA